MSAPRLEIHLDRIHHNARVLVERLRARGIDVTGVTKATLGSPEIARELIGAGVGSIGESRIENIEAMHLAGLSPPMTLIRAPMPSQAERVVAHADVSLNTELDTIDRLSVAATAQHRPHRVLLMVELGDLREGIMPGDLGSVALRASRLPHIVVCGIGTNLACQSGVAPDRHNMAELSALATSLEATLGAPMQIVSGGNSANLDWALGGADVGRINNLRLGESILLGREPLRRRPIDGLCTDAITLIGEVIESKSKPTRPRGRIEQSAFGEPSGTGPDARGAGRTDRTRTDRTRTIVALGRQDADPAGLGAPAGWEILGASSDHLVLDAGSAVPAIGSEVRFQPDYSALLRAMTSPFVSRVFVRDDT